jgi:uncharacterized membrane protein
MLGLTTVGVYHTAISLLALGAGIILLIRDHSISWRTSLGKVYVITTILTCLTSLVIFQHGGFGKPHVLALPTLIVLAIAALAGYTHVFGRLSRYVETISYSATFLFHLIPGITETSTRLPRNAPLIASPDAPELQAATALLAVIFLIGATLQILSLRSRPPA